MSAMIQLSPGAEAEGIKLGGAQATQGILTGANCRVGDIVVQGSYTEGDIVVQGNRTHVSGVLSNPDYAVVHVNNADYVAVSKISSSSSLSGCAVRLTTALHATIDGVSSFQDENGVIVESNSNWFTLTNIHVRESDAVAVSISTSSWGTFDGVIDQCGQHGLLIDGASDNRISGQFYANGSDTTNTYDNISITGASNRNFINQCVLRPRVSGADTRYGVNVGGTGECNMVVGNDLGDATDYGSDALNDAASNTQLFWPADATYGDNFTDCGSGS